MACQKAYKKCQKTDSSKFRTDSFQEYLCLYLCQTSVPGGCSATQNASIEEKNICRKRDEEKRNKEYHIDTKENKPAKRKNKIELLEEMSTRNSHSHCRRKANVTFYKQWRTNDSYHK